MRRFPGAGRSSRSGANCEGGVGMHSPRHPSFFCESSEDRSVKCNAMTTVEIAEMRGNIVQWDGKHGVIKTDAGIEIDFFPLHLVANGYTDRVKVGDRMAFRCEVISTRTYCLNLIRAVAVS
jgi:hypothetical protein